MESTLQSSLKKNPIRTFEKRVLDRVYKPLVKWYTGRERPYNYRKVSITVLPGVFHPGLFYSTRMMLDYLEFVNMQGRRLLELGAGSGLISVVAACEGSFVTASDISPTAIMNLRINRDRNLSRIESVKGTLEIVQSDLFEKVNRRPFDIIVINPPYYCGPTEKPEDYAWYCGVEFDYFKRMFSELGTYLHADTEAVMILSDDCDLRTIRSIAESKGFQLDCVMKRRNLIEKNFIFKIRPK